jgi:transglutaminase-like putative cysteine protease
MTFRVVHTTRYTYSRRVSLCYNVAHLKPRNFDRQTCVSSRIDVVPAPATLNEWVDFFGNQTTYFAVQAPHSELTVTATSEIEVSSQLRMADPGIAIPWNDVTGHLRAPADAETRDAQQYTLESPFVSLESELAQYGRQCFGEGRPLVDAVHDLMGRIHRDFTYDPAFSTIATPLQDVLAHRRGVCQDFAHLAIGCLRAQGLAARYVSGYLETDPPPGQKKLVGADESHAWFSVYVPGQGWLDFDPTNNQIPMDRHIVTAWGRDYGDITPIKGVIFGGGSNQSLQVSVDVSRI